MATKKLKKYDRVEVSWNDHYGTNPGWSPNNAVLEEKAFKCASMGYFMGEDKDHMFIVQTLNDQDEHIHLMGILKPAITKVQKL